MTAACIDRAIIIDIAKNSDIAYHSEFLYSSKIMKVTQPSPEDESDHESDHTLETG